MMINMMYTIPLAVRKGTIICRTVIQIYFRDNPVYYFLFDHGSYIFHLTNNGKVLDHIHGLIVLPMYSLFSLQCLESTASTSPCIVQVKY